MTFGWLFRWWRARQRSIDLDILWPACKQKAPGMDAAKAAFAAHAFYDTAWTADMTDDEIHDFIQELS